ncbi:MAG: uroporphyrinogen-III synthase [Thiotrichales bacterium]
MQRQADTTETQPLQSLIVLVTRPRDQGDAFAARIRACGGLAIQQPTIEIAPVSDADAVARALDQLAQFDDAVFVSANAAESFVRYLNDVRREMPRGLRIAAIGTRTAHRLTELGLPVHLSPPSPYNSEALLALPAFRSLAGRHILILRGGQGRDLLAETFARRGAVVTLLDVYRRMRPETLDATVSEALAAGRIDLLTITSAEGLRNLFAMTPEFARSALLATPVLVGSARMVETCLELGFKIPAFVADNPSDDSMFGALIQWAATKRRN